MNLTPTFSRLNSQSNICPCNLGIFRKRRELDVKERFVFKCVQNAFKTCEADYSKIYLVSNGVSGTGHYIFMSRNMVLGGCGRIGHGFKTNKQTF